MSPEKHAELLAEFDAMGEARVRHLVQLNHWASDTYRKNTSQEWLLLKESERAARTDAREEESLSISRKALSNSRLATRIAISAIVLSIIMAIQKLIEWSSK